MTPSPSTDPAEATLSEALAILRSTWKPNLDLIFRGQYLFWLGSGISSSRFGSLDALLRTLLLTLQARCKNSADCPYRQALTQILQRTSLTSTEIASINFAQAPTTWPRLDEIVNQLRNQYSTILAIPILDPELLSIPWDVLKLQNVYSDDSKQPDAEHRCLAVMIEEGFLPNLISINWDPLIEKAHKACRAGKSEALQVVASNDDLNRGNNGTAPRLFKIHGCAQKAVADPTHYQRFMVATIREIANWETSSAPLVEASRTLIRECPSLFVGLSGQDFTLKTVFANIKGGHDTPYPPSPPRVVFCATDLSPDQHAILTLIYDEASYAANAAVLMKKAVLPLYAKPLLATLYLLGLRAKIEALFGRGEPEIAKPLWDMAFGVIQRTEERLCQIFDPIVPADDRWRALVEHASRFVNRLMALYQEQKLHSDPDAYEPLSSFNTGKIEDLSPAVMGQLHWLFLALSCIVEGERRGYWTVEVPLDRNASEGQLVLRSVRGAISVFLLNLAMYRSRLEQNVLTSQPSPNPVVVLYPTDAIPSTSGRSPRRSLPGATADPDEVTEISLQELLGATTTEDALLDAFHKENETARTS